MSPSFHTRCTNSNFLIHGFMSQNVLNKSIQLNLFLNYCQKNTQRYIAIYIWIFRDEWHNCRPFFAGGGRHRQVCPRALTHYFSPVSCLTCLLSHLSAKTDFNLSVSTKLFSISQTFTHFLSANTFKRHSNGTKFSSLPLSALSHFNLPHSILYSVKWYISIY